MDIPRTIGYTEIVKIAECALNGDSERARVFLKRYIGKYPDKDLVYPFTHLLNGVTNPSGLNSNIIPACEGKADSTSEKDLRVCEVSNSLPLILGLDNPYPLRDVLERLKWATNYLLHEKNYDGHSYEELNQCVRRANEIIATLNGNGC